MDAHAGHLVTLINDTIYHELRRLEEGDRKGRRNKQDASYYHGVRRRLRAASSADLPALLEEILQRFCEEIVGNFDERVYQLIVHSLHLVISERPLRRAVDQVEGQ